MITKEQIIFRLLAAIHDLNEAYAAIEPYEHVGDAVAKLEALIAKLDEIKP